MKTPYFNFYGCGALRRTHCLSIILPYLEKNDSAVGNFFPKLYNGGKIM